MLSKKVFYLIFIGCLSLAADVAFSLNINVMTFNLDACQVLPNPKDKKDPRTCYARKENMEYIINSKNYDFIATQEADIISPTFEGIQYNGKIQTRCLVANNLGDTHFNQITGDEECITFEDPSSFATYTLVRLLFNSNNWSIDPNEPPVYKKIVFQNLAPGKRYLRVIGMAHFIGKNTFAGKSIYVMDTHYPTYGEDGNNTGIKTINTLLEQRKNKNDPVVLMGDFNTPVPRVMQNFPLQDAYAYIDNQVGGPKRQSFHALTNDFIGITRPDGLPDKRLDFIFYSNNLTLENAEIEHYPARISREIRRDMMPFSSDHFPVAATLGFE